MKKLAIAVIVILSVVPQVASANQVVNYQPQQEKTIELAQATSVLDTQKTQRYISNKLQTRIQNDFEKQLKNDFNLDL